MSSLGHIAARKLQALDALSGSGVMKHDTECDRVSNLELARIAVLGLVTSCALTVAFIEIIFYWH